METPIETVPGQPPGRRPVSRRMVLTIASAVVIVGVVLLAWMFASISNDRYCSDLRGRLAGLNDRVLEADDGPAEVSKQELRGQGREAGCW